MKVMFSVLSVCLSVCLSICLSVCLSVRAITFECLHLETSFLVHWVKFKVTVIGKCLLKEHSVKFEYHLLSSVGFTLGEVQGHSDRKMLIKRAQCEI